MKKNKLFIITSALILTSWLYGCTNTTTPIPAIIPTDEVKIMPTATATTTNTPDPCSTENIKGEVDNVHKHMREFDDASTLAASLPREQLSGPIANLQKIRRDAEDEVVPSCLSNLKELQIKHMNSVISTFIAFLSVSDPHTIDCSSGGNSTDEAAICQNIAAAREEHDQYTVELARLLGIPIVTATAVITPPETPTP